MADPYAVLELDRNANPSQTEIRRAYRRLALRYHPDKNPGDAQAAQKFGAVTDAFSRLSTGAKLEQGGAKEAQAQPDTRDQFRRELEKREQGDGMSTGRIKEAYRKRNREAMENLTRKWARDQASAPVQPKLDDIDACITFNSRTSDSVKDSYRRTNSKILHELINELRRRSGGPEEVDLIT